MRREFAVVPPDLRLTMLMPALSLTAALAGLSFAARDEPRIWLVAIPIVLIVGLLIWSIRRRRVTIEGDRLRIASSLHTTIVRATELDLDAAGIVDLAEAKALRPKFQRFGTSIPGFHAGHFRLRNRARAFVLLTGRSKVLALPERSGRMLLLSLEKPQALLDTLKAVAMDDRRR